MIYIYIYVCVCVCVYIEMRVLCGLYILEKRKLIILIRVNLKAVLKQKIVKPLGLPFNKISFPF